MVDDNKVNNSGLVDGGVGLDVLSGADWVLDSGVSVRDLVLSRLPCDGFEAYCGEGWVPPRYRGNWDSVVADLVVVCGALRGGLGRVHALSLAGYGGAATATSIATNVADVGSQYFLMQPWGRDQELEADKLGMMIIHLAGYDITQIPQFWARMSGGNHKHDFFSTHPTDKKRIRQMEKLVPKITNCDDFTSKPILKLI